MKIYCRTNNVLTLIVLCLLTACGDNREAALLSQLPAGLKSLGLQKPAEALAVHTKLYDEALELERTRQARKLNLDRTIGMLALRRAMLADILGKSEDVQAGIEESLRRFDRGGVIPASLPSAEKKQLLEQTVEVILKIEQPSWSDTLLRSWTQKGILLGKDKPKAGPNT